MKILCVCEGGNVRSVACAYVFKYEHGHDALAVSTRKNNLETHQMLWEWADRIVVMQPEFKRFVLPQYQGKVFICDVGPDRWFNCLDPELVLLIRAWVAADKSCWG